MSTKRAKLQAVVVEIPTSIEQVDKSISKIARIQREIDETAQLYADRILAIEAEAKEKVAPLKKEVQTTFAGIYAFCEANRPELTRDGKKTIELSSGTLCWRFNPPSVAVKSGLKVAQVVATLRRHGLARFIRVKREINKEAILESPASIIGVPGISIVQEETFNVKPKEYLSEISVNSDVLQKLISK